MGQKLLASRQKVTTTLAAFAVTASLVAFTPLAASAEDVPAGPGSASLVQTNGTVRMVWTEVPGSSSYRVEMSYAPDFSSILEANETTGRTYVPKGYYRNAGARTLYWRVSARVDNAVTPWTVGEPLVLDAQPAPTGLTPTPASVFAYPAPVSFGWNTVRGAVGYEVQYVAGGDFSSNATVSVFTEDSAVTPTSRLVNGNYEWRVRAKLYSSNGENNYSAWSTPQDFTVVWRTQDSTVPQLTPAATAQGVPSVSDPIFRWSPVKGASYYKITVARDFAMSNTIIKNFNVYGTTYVPEGNLLNGEYYWTVTAYDAAGNPGFTPDVPRKFVKRWGRQFEPIQPNGEDLDAYPVPIGPGSSSADPSIRPTVNPSKLEFKWEPIPRATKYRLVVTPYNGGSPVTCITPNTQATLVAGYGAGPQSSEVFQGEGSCLGLSLPPGTFYSWRVQGIDMAAAGGTYGTGELVSAESPQRYFELGPKSGGAAYSDLTGVVQSGPWSETVTEPSPLMEWDAVNNCPVDRPEVTYEVRVYRGPGTTTHVATFTTEQTVLRPNGVFRDDNTASNTSYNWRVRVKCSGAYLGLRDWDQLTSRLWTRTTSPSEIPADFVEESNGNKLLRWTPQFDVYEYDGGNYGYQLDYRLKGSVDWRSTHQEYPFWVPSDAGTPLPNGNYEFRVAPLDANKSVGRWSATKDFTIGIAVPSNVIATVKSSSVVDLTWEPSPVAEGYQVRWQQVGESGWTTGPFTQQTSFTAGNLIPGNYNFMVQARARGNQWSQWSAATPVTIAPKTMTTVTANNAVLSVDDRLLQWNAVPGVSRYMVQFASSQDGVFQTNPHITVGTTYSINDDVQYGQQYYWRVVALGESGSYWSGLRVGSTNVQSVYFKTTPRSPRPVGVEASGAALNVKWEALSTAGAGEASGLTYRVRYRKFNQTPAAQWQYSQPTSGSATSMVISPLELATEYEFQVAATNTQGTGRWTDSMRGSTAKLPSAPEGLAINNVSVGVVQVSWGTPNNGGLPITAYRLKWRPVSSTAWQSVLITPSANNLYELKGMNANVDYVYELTAITDAGEGPAAVKQGHTIGFPSAPQNLTLGSKNGSVTARWAPPADAGSSPVKAYVLEYRTLASGKWSAWAVVTEADITTYTMTGLVNGQQYQYRVLAKNTEGSSSYSNVAEVAPGLPGAPKVKLANGKGKYAGKIKVTWSGAATGGGVIKAYTFQYSLDGKKWKALKTVSSKTKLIVKKLGKPGKYVYVRGMSKNQYGSSPYGKAVKIKVKKAPKKK